MEQTDENTPQLVDRAGKALAKGRIAPALRSAIKLIVEEGYTIADAAKAVGYQTHSLTQALHKPHVRALRASVAAAWRASETEAAWHIVSGLAKGSPSDDVRLKAARTVLEAAGELRPKADEPGLSRTLINIVLSGGRVDAEAGRLPGVIEAPKGDRE
jgi:hypothetical protein